MHKVDTKEEGVYESEKHPWQVRGKDSEIKLADDLVWLCCCCCGVFVLFYLLLFACFKTGSYQVAVVSNTQIPLLPLLKHGDRGVRYTPGCLF